MPQLVVDYYLSQSFWVVLLFVIFFCLCTHYIIPSIYRSIRIRSYYVSLKGDQQKGFSEEVKLSSNCISSVYEISFMECRKMFDFFEEKTNAWISDQFASIQVQFLNLGDKILVEKWVKFQEELELIKKRKA